MLISVTYAYGRRDTQRLHFATKTVDLPHFDRLAQCARFLANNGFMDGNNGYIMGGAILAIEETVPPEG